MPVANSMPATTKRLAKSKTISDANKTDDMIEQMILGKRRRGRTKSDFETYKSQTMDKIEELDEKIRTSVEKTPKELKRLKNMVSAYESRLVKRATMEDLREQLEIRNEQVKTILKIMKEELEHHDLVRVISRIRKETPQMVIGSSVSKSKKDKLKN